MVPSQRKPMRDEKASADHGLMGMMIKPKKTAARNKYKQLNRYFLLNFPPRTRTKYIEKAN
jgi:hypothetical protein